MLHLVRRDRRGNIYMYTFPEVADLCRLPCIWSPSYDELHFVFAAVRKYAPKSIVEIGTGAGGGTCVLHFAMPSAMIHTYDISTYLEAAEGKPPGYVAMPYVSENVIFHYRSTAVDIRMLVDFAYIDGDHRHADTFVDFVCCFFRARFPYTVALHDVGLADNIPGRKAEYGPTRLWEVLKHLQPRWDYEMSMYETMGIVHFPREYNVHCFIGQLFMALEETATHGKRVIDIHDYKV